MFSFWIEFFGQQLMCPPLPKIRQRHIPRSLPGLLCIVTSKKTKATATLWLIITTLNT